MELSDIKEVTAFRRKPKNINVKNLLLMAEYIKGIPQSEFDMKKFRSGNLQTHECGSVGCVIGHCIILDKSGNIPVNSDGDINFFQWSFGFTGIDHAYSTQWQWLFGDGWSISDNTPLGASIRIKYFLEFGVPEDWDDMLAPSEEKHFVLAYQKWAVMNGIATTNELPAISEKLQPTK